MITSEPVAVPLYQHICICVYLQPCVYDSCIAGLLDVLAGQQISLEFYVVSSDLCFKEHLLYTNGM